MALLFWPRLLAVLILVSALRYAAPDNHDTANALHDHAAMAVDFAEVFRSSQNGTSARLVQTERRSTKAVN